MNKKVLRIALIVGLVLIVASIVIPLVRVLAATSGVNPEQGIVGGVDAPTFLFFCSQFSKVYSWLMLIGLCLVIGSFIGRIAFKK